MKHQLNIAREGIEAAIASGVFIDKPVRRALLDALTALSELERMAGEPVAEVYRHGKDSRGREWHGIHWYDPNVGVPNGTQLYIVAPPAQQPPEIEVQCPVCAHKFYEWPNDQQPQAEPDMRKVCEALGFDPTNHHNAAKCPYCRGQQPQAEHHKCCANCAEHGECRPNNIRGCDYDPDDACNKQPQAEAVRWCPDVCPITGKPFFMWIGHPKHGEVPTYGGPYDSYTIPVRHEDGSFCCERYDHDNGWWVTDEVHDVGVQIVSDQAYVSDEAPQQAEAVPPGFVLVPVEPTKAMIDAMQSSGWMPANYRAMLAAAKGEKP